MREVAAPKFNSPNEDLLDVSGVGSYLVRRGLIPDTEANVTRLAGGVSNVVFAVEHHDGLRFLVKQSLGQLAVADDWFAPTDRVITEAAAMVLSSEITPRHVPIVYDQDPRRHAITLELAPRGWADWKTYLMAGQVQPAVAGGLGEVLAAWHQRSFVTRDMGQRLESYSTFDQLRLDPYYRTVAERAPEVAVAMTALIERMAQRRLCLVHGDFSPKNILVAPESATASSSTDELAFWVIDFEVAHRGDPAFDVAFMCTHLLLKSIALPDSRDSLDNCIRAFTSAYCASLTSDGNRKATAKAAVSSTMAPLNPDWTYIAHQIGALLLARVRGKSPVGYLTVDGEQAAWNLGIRLLTAEESTVEGFFLRRNESLP